MNLFTGIVSAAVGAEEDAEAGFLQDLHVVVVGIAHGPSGTMSSCFFTIRPIHQTYMTVHPIVELVVTTHLINNHHTITFILNLSWLGGDLSRCFNQWFGFPSRRDYCIIMRRIRSIKSNCKCLRWWRGGIVTGILGVNKDLTNSASSASGQTHRQAREAFLACFFFSDIITIEKSRQIFSKLALENAFFIILKNLENESLINGDSSGFFVFGDPFRGC